MKGALNKDFMNAGYSVFGWETEAPALEAGANAAAGASAFCI